MSVETPSMFAKVIKDHLALKERNQRHDARMPLDRYKVEDPFQNHPLFKTEEQARLEETMDGVQPDFVAHSVDAFPAWPGEQAVEAVQQSDVEDSGFWEARSRDFDWGD